jgi:succinyl-diaminopimelate desuccinylase
MTTTPTGRPIITADDVLAAANADQDSVLALARDLITIPSRGGIDPYDRILNRTADWLAHRQLPAQILRDATGAAVGLASEIHGHRPGKRWVLNACLDTAPFGDEDAWTHPPTTPVVQDGWLWGRGAADSKTSAAIFCHIGARIHQLRDRLTGTLVLLYDVDEHTGAFGGAKTYFQRPDIRDDVAGVMIGYAGIDKIVVGGRGVHRTRLHIHGIASHAGSSTTTPSAIAKAAHLIQQLSDTELPTTIAPGFPLPGKVTVTAITGGAGYSTTPDLCTINVDVRTTPMFDDTAAAKLLRDIVSSIDIAWPTTKPTLIEDIQRWPPYALPDSLPAKALFAAADSLGIVVTPKIAGPSNIGNLLAGMGIPATAGFGVDKVGEHATDERIRINSIPLTQAVYHTAILDLLAGN